MNSFHINLIGKYSLLALLFLSITSMSTVDVSAQSVFYGSNVNNYTCYERDGDPGVFNICEADRSNCKPVNPSSPDANNELSGFNNPDYICVYSDGFETQAIPKPPTIQIIEIWFVRILYVVWAFSGIAFTFILISIGFEYMTSFGNAQAQAHSIKRLRYWIIGLGLVFLAYPMLNTFFSILPINRDAACLRDLDLPGFHIFYPEACVISGD